MVTDMCRRKARHSMEEKNSAMDSSLDPTETRRMLMSKSMRD
jgi:hypothetical protein